MNVIDLDKNGNVIKDISKVKFDIEIRKIVIQAFEKSKRGEEKCQH
ncbi:hypothetical protein K5E_25240 [Enterococcus thailandicus]|nr:hypothetical protein [Enterococcus thailandicus]GMC10385.1 hypothetical protein K5E_25240 [Enterococcus thailandicus]